MPIITINLDERAYDIYRQLEKGKRSRQMSTALIQWWYSVQEYTKHSQERREKREADEE